MIDYLRTSAEETDFVLRYPEECDGFTYEGEKELIRNFNNSESMIMLVCMVEGELAGNCCLSWDTKIKIRHRANVAIALLKKYWNLGIGTKLFECMIKIAESDSEIIQMELEFIEGNSRARALYEKMGFKIKGVKPNAIRLKDGTRLDEYEMVRVIR